MKSAYELAMERLSKSAPTVKPTNEQKKQLAELDSVYKAKTAEREIHFQGELAKAAEKGDAEEYAKQKQRLAQERQKLQEELETKKERVRTASA